MRTSLSQSQLGVYYACVTNNDEFANYQNPVLLDIPKDVNVEQVRKAVYEALCAHPYIASHIVLGADGTPEVESGEFPEIDKAVPLISAGSIEDVKSGFARTMDINADKLYRCELYQAAEGKAWLYLDFHHVIADGFSVVLILRDIERCFNGQEPLGEEIDGNAIAQEEEALRADEAKMTEAREWYGKTFCDAAETDSLPIPENTLGDVPAEMCLKHYPLSVTKEDVQAVMSRFGVKEGTLMQAAWALLLAAYGAEDKASYCTLYFGRGDRRTRSAVTMMVHTLPVFVQFQGEEPIAELFASLAEQKATAERLEYYAYQDAVKEMGLNNQVMFVYHGSVLNANEELHFGESMVTYHDLRKQIPGWKMVAELFEKEGTYSLKLGYSSTDYSDAFMTELAACYSAILRSMLTANIVKEVEYATSEQVNWLNGLNPDLSTLNSKLSTLNSLVERFKQHVAERPNDIFCVAGDKRLTFAEVDKLTDTIDPSYTVRCGERVVGFSVPRDEKMVLAPLAIAKAGLTQLPLDSSYPEERLEFMKQDAAAYDGNDALVLLYTSGTTGTPKGVILTEENFRIFSDFHVKHTGLKADSRYATYAGYGFDAYQHDLWACVWAGATIYIIQDDIRFNLEALYEYLTKEGITHCFMTTQMATQMALSYPEIGQLQFLGTGGEKLMSLDPPSYRLLNAYGPTETTCYVCSHFVDKNEPNIPIGKPNDAVELHIVNRFGKQVPWGCCGELIIAGPQVGVGYLNQPERTAAAFVEWNGKRVYRTGDIVRYRDNGDIEFVGRKDGQVKIRGFRIELKECTVFQPFNNHTELLGDVLRLMEKVGKDMRFVEAEEFEQTIAVAGQDPEKAKLLAALVAYQDVAHGQKTSIIERDNRYTCSVLHRLGFHWSDTSSEYIIQMLRQIAAFGFFE